MAEQQRHWSPNQQVEWPRVNPYTITQLVGEVGNIHISENGRYHVYWHRQRPNGSVTLIHHGGPLGFDSLKAVMHQHERVILKYTGLTIQVPLSQAEEIPQEEQQEGAPMVGQPFPQLIEQLETLEIPGEQHTLGRWIKVLQDANRDLPQVTTHGHLTMIREGLTNVRDNLSRSINIHKRTSASALTNALSGTRGDLLSGVNEAQLQLLARTQQTVQIVVGTMQRYNALERLQISWNGILDKLPQMVGRSVLALQSPEFNEERLTRTISVNLLHESLGLTGQLSQLKGEPYFGRAQNFIEALSPVSRLWEERDYQGMIKILQLQGREFEIWRRRTKEEYEGVNFGKYALS